MSKGSSPRAVSITKEAFNNNWDAIFGKSKSSEDAVYVVKEQSKAEYRVYTSEGQELHAIVYPSSVFGKNESIYSTVSVHGYQEYVLHQPNIIDAFTEQVKRISAQNKTAAKLVNIPEVGDLLLGWCTPNLFFNKLAKTKNLGVSHNPIGFCQELLLLANIGSHGECRIYSGAKAGLYTVFLLDELDTNETFFNINAHELAGIEKKMIAKIDLTTEWLREFGFLAEKTGTHRG